MKFTFTVKRLLGYDIIKTKTLSRFLKLQEIYFNRQISEAQKIIDEFYLCLQDQEQMRKEIILNLKNQYGI